MQLFKSTKFNFIGNRNKAFALSAALVLITIVSLIYHPLRDGMGPKMSIDFVGGTLVQLKFEKPVVDDLAKIRASIDALGFGQPEVKTVGGEGNEVQIVVNKKAEGTLVGDEIRAGLARDYAENPFELRREEKVGPKIGGELQQKALMAGLLSLLAILVYIGIRFHLPFGIAAIVALFHDVVITIGVFSVFNLEISLPIIAALLTIIGYSLNDTIVVFDRIRENLGGTISRTSFEDKVNASINECLSRTIITSVTTLAVVVTIYGFFFTSGDVIKYFAVALITGVIVGTYSSMFIASPTLVMWNKKWPLK
ncbi:MAG: protein translocase subunit SecF [Chitinivibrionales bacterium]|nr:protein translocase subunit SecF [Chitinivibrionales bacterium]MBD3394397.1 protein translocase subunit SecF [Chitinivibrionales bacterium]